jgi:tripartite-type tricarboxylate transporter receptor subunit TctC
MSASRVWCAALGAALALSAAAQAAEGRDGYPSKPVRILVGYAPGGGVDVTARFVAAALGELWGTSAIVDNRAGAAGGVATELTAKANPDGYTLLFCTIASHAITPARTRNLPYDHIRDVPGISMIGKTPNVLMVYPGMPAKSLREFIEMAKASPGKITFGSSGVGASPHLSIELLKSMTGINIVHVPYKGAAPALTDVMGGQIPASVGNLPGGPLAAIKANRVRALGVTTAKRNRQAPDVPTFQEGGVAGYDVSSWYGICGPKLPRRLAARLNADLVKVLNGPLKAKLEEQGIEVTPTSPEEFLAYIKAETATWAKVVKEAGLVGD